MRVLLVGLLLFAAVFASIDDTGLYLDDPSAHHLIMAVDAAIAELQSVSDFDTLSGMVTGASCGDCAVEWSTQQHQWPHLAEFINDDSNMLWNLLVRGTDGDASVFPLGFVSPATEGVPYATLPTTAAALEVRVFSQCLC
ncbi:hypothetical protein KIPB_012627 [Kipferlia bialata]|uniref:Secreted protein n=1 Tax=Kipferlia bialata TaxID=797122 RepID=A0A9K3GNZ5_9EUKA|nr:hypothetical protein KIPB_012627 [Kipferlia bialata]|eukprot:g12627.t1